MYLRSGPDEPYMEFILVRDKECYSGPIHVYTPWDGFAYLTIPHIFNPYTEFLFLLF